MTRPRRPDGLATDEHIWRVAEAKATLLRGRLQELEARVVKRDPDAIKQSLTGELVARVAEAERIAEQAAERAFGAIGPVE